MFISQVGKRIYRIARFGQIEFNITNIKVIIVKGGSTYHVKPIEFMEEGFTFLKGILRRNNKPYFVQVSGFHHNIGNDHMPGMNGIKRAKE